MSQYDFSYNYDSLNDAFNAVNRKGKMQKRSLFVLFMIRFTKNIISLQSQKRNISFTTKDT